MLSAAAADAFSFAGRFALSTVVGFLSFLQELEQRELSRFRMVVAAMCGWGRNRMAEFRSWRKEDLHWQQERRCRWWRKKDGEAASGVALAALSMPMESAAARLAIVAVFSGVRVQEAILLPLWRSSPSTAPMETTSMTWAWWMATTWRSESFPVAAMALAAALDALVTSIPSARKPSRFVVVLVLLVLVLVLLILLVLVLLHFFCQMQSG